MARVYRGTDRFLDRPVAVKMLDVAAARSADPANHARFLNEARSAASFQHPNAVAVYDAGESDGELYIVMELVTGETLAERLAAHGPLPTAVAVTIADRLLDVLAAMHARNTVHRDVKPSNVLLDRHGTVKLTDFGIAKRLDEIDEALTSAGTVIGTPQYLAPEQAVGGEIAATTDVYLAGALLYEMLTGARPASPVAGAHIRSTDPRERRPDVSAGLAAVAERALAYRPEDRFPTAAAMRAALIEAADGGVVDTPGGRAGSATAEFPAEPVVDSTDDVTTGGTAVDVPTRTMAASGSADEPATTMSSSPVDSPSGNEPSDGHVDVRSASADAPAQPQPTTDQGPPAPRFPVRIAMAGLVVLAVVFTVGLVITLASDDGDQRTVEQPTVDGDQPPAEQATAVGDEFLRRLRADADQFGVRGPDVRDALEDVLSIADADRRAESEEQLKVDVFIWVADGELDTSVGASVQAVLDGS